MISLIKNELTKIFKKKGIYITFLVILAFVILTNVIYKFADNFLYGSYYYYAEEYREWAEEYLATLDPNNLADASEYASVKASIEIYNLSKDYEEDSWQITVINERAYQYAYDINTYIYVEKDEVKLAEAQAKYDKLIERLKNDDWRAFVQEDLDVAVSELEALENQKEEVIDRTIISNLESQIYYKEIEIEILNWRLSKDINFANSYLNDALRSYEWAKQSIRTYEEDEDKTYSEKLTYYQDLSNEAMARYIIENKVNLNATDSRGILMGFLSEYELFIIVVIVMVTGAIVAEEFSRGTIKLLLIRPHKRTKMLLAKFMTVLIVILIAILVTIVMQLIVGGVFFGFDSFKTPAIVYDYNQGGLIEMNMASYLGIQILARLPLYILVATIAFAFSTIFTNTALAITISLLGYISSSIINMLVYEYNVKFMKFFITMNWDLSQYLFGNLPTVEYVNFGFSAVMCAVYFVAMMIPTFIIFKKKNIKNV